MNNKQTIDSSNLIVIKIGSVLISDSMSGTVKQDWIDAFAQDVKALMDQGKQVVVVSSGGVALGRADLGIAMDAAPLSIPLELKQASSSIGQYHMFHGYHTALSAQGLAASQILLTIADTESRRSYLNARDTIRILLSHGVVPVINENDAVSSEEIRFGDNDRLAVRVAQMIEADLVVLLSTTDGLYTDNPDTNADAMFIPLVEAIGEEHVAMAGEAVPGLSTGGMQSKVQAALASTKAGIDLLITEGRAAHSLSALQEDADKKATLFKALDKAPNARKKWLQSHLNPKGAVRVDEGALKALKSGKSLLPVGVCVVEGSFDRGDVIEIHDAEGRKVAIGLSAYSSDDTARIMRHSSAEITEILGYIGRDELVHRNDMVLG